MIQRQIENQIKESFNKNKVIILLGPRQTGKTTLLKHIFSNIDEHLWLSGDEYDIQQAFENPTSTALKAFIGNYKYVVIDEAQNIENIGTALKLLVDNFNDLQVIATGSSSFELGNKTNEPLTGRKFEYRLFPFSLEEMINHHGLLQETRLLKHRLVYGMYPEVINNENSEKDILKLLADSYLFRDILMLESIKKPDKLVKLLQALAYQIGSEVSYNEIGKLIGLDSKTVEVYIDLLEKSFVVFRLNSFSRNHRSELKKSKKVFFYDNGIRNAVISNYAYFDVRDDKGALWENFLIAERMKFNHYHKHYVNSYFWRTKNQQEIDYIEEGDGKLSAFEMKWNSNKKHKITKAFTNTYPNSTVKIIHSENYHEWLTS